jgi:hypothetical protein
MLPLMTATLDLGPAEPDRALAAMERLRALRTVLDDPAMHGGGSHLHPPFLPAFFAMARAQRLRPIPTAPHQHDLFGAMGPLASDGQGRLPHDAPLLTGEEPTSNRFKEKL